jgi:hypothetical protein
MKVYTINYNSMQKLKFVNKQYISIQMRTLFTKKPKFKTRRNFNLGTHFIQFIETEWEREFKEIQNKGINRLALNQEILCTIQTEIELFEKKFDFSMQKYLFESNYKSLDINERGNVQLTKFVENYYINIEVFKFKPNVDSELLNKTNKEYMEREYIKPTDNIQLLVGEHLPKDEVDEFSKNIFKYITFIYIFLLHF